jgi:hypothetical protein
MKRLPGLAAGAAQRCLLRAGSLLIPAAQRQEWLREWEAELWHVRRACAPGHTFSWQSEREIAAFCLGAFSDALCLRSHAAEHERGINSAGPIRIDTSAGQCLLRLAAILALCGLCAWLLPGVRAEIDMARYRTRSGLILFDSSIPVEQFHDWRRTSQSYFDGLAFYRTVGQNVSTSSGYVRTWQVAHASSNLFEILGLPVKYSASASQNDPAFPAVLISQQAWYRDYGANSQIVGQLAQIGTRTVRIAGVVPYGVWRLPSNPDAWLLESDSQLASEVSPAAQGFVLGHLTRAGQELERGNRVFVNTYGTKNESIVLNATAVDDRTPTPWEICAFALLLVALALPAVTSVSMSESQFSSFRPTRKRRIFRWLFLAGKIALVAVASCLIATDVAYGFAAFDSSTAELLQFAICFAAALFGMRWALADQSRRCPVCLRCVAHPAQVGLASHTFLGWSGTEMMCLGGHTLLHVPSLPTSWFGSQRWLYLDTSWEFLFADL